MQLPLTSYYVQQAMLADDCEEFTHQFLTKVLQNADILPNFQLIDLQNLTDQVVYDLVYAKFQLGLNDLKSQILLNIFYELYSYQNPKFTRKEPQPKQTDASERKSRKQTKMIIVKSQEQDWKLLKDLLQRHSSYGDKSQKYFTSKQLDLIINYARST